jgi:hypothetical protein
MTYKKISLGIVFILLISIVYANPYENIENKLSEYFEISFSNETHDKQNFAALIDDTLGIKYNNKELNINTKSFRFEPVKLKIIIEDDMPGVVITYDEQELIIKQLGNETSTVFFNVPDILLLKNKLPLVYFVNHYDPDVPTVDKDRTSGEKRLTAITSNAIVEIDNGIKIRTDGLKVSTKTFLSTNNFENKQIDFIKDNILTEIFSSAKNLILQTYEKFRFDNLFDRGYTTNSEPKKLSTESNSDIIWKCNKLGFVFLPELEYDYLDQVNSFTKGQGYVLSTAYSKNDKYQNALYDMIDFVNNAHENNLIPIVRVAGNYWYSEVMPVNDVVNFINDLKLLSNNKIEYIQIWDKPNLEYVNNDYFSDPYNYYQYVKEIKEKLNDPNIKIISASLSIGPNNDVGDEFRKSSSVYFNRLLEIEEFWDIINYWGSSSYELNESGSNYCYDSNDDELCYDNKNAYMWEHDKINNITKKDIKIFLTDVGYHTEFSNRDKTIELLNQINNNENVKGATLFIANGWDIFTNSNWFDKETNELTTFAKSISDKICG